MKIQKNTFYLLSILFGFGTLSVAYGEAPYAVTIPVGGNSWVTDTVNGRDRVITAKAIENWTSKENTIRTFFHLEQTGTLEIALRARVLSGVSELTCTFCDQTRTVTLDNTDYTTIKLGVFTVAQPGYQYLDLQGIRKSARTFAEVTDLLIGGEAAKGNVVYVKDDFYFGKRGPSVHLNYQIPETVKDVLYFYNEITIPAGNDVIGSFFMANGFGQGYFGMQVNSPQERRILFSVWSPYRTDNPQDIPPDQRIQLLKKGKTVHAGKFGGEGSGGQSYRRYTWKTETPYRFLLKGEPREGNTTDFTAYFFAPEIGKWELIASFRRPQTHTYLQRLHSFLENFIPATGQYQRRGYYANQWIGDAEGHWTELVEARFTADATARKGARLDYAGGAQGDTFFLENCGFFNDPSKIDTVYTREPTGQKPDIDLEELP
jgi:hypothetical protein